LRDKKLTGKRRTILRRTLATADPVRDQLRLVRSECDREVLFDKQARARLVEVAAKAHVVTGSVLRNPLLGQTQQFAPGLWALIRAMHRHTTEEVRNPLERSEWVSAEDTIAKVRETRWGTECVERIIEQIQDEVTGHPSYPQGHAK
jgi:hypothetical protein